ncbi:hypothetical protein EYZ11_002168 [Aspergillus tanneri]|uniref:Ubiquitin interaction motif protein n=1 Tax=Aspergillus tanneri TaxID=1220188 RepID=A0A4S3JTG6_9EURO|nr:hypothetical protein EYZ11_002168 [Aspergillus tanneri]
MTSEPTEEAIANFVSFTSTSRDQAISFLKANDLNSNKAINAYFEDPTGPHTVTPNYQNDPSVPSFQIEHSDPVLGSASVAPSRPPSSTNLSEQAQMSTFNLSNSASTQETPADASKGLSLAEQEERQLQQAVAMSLNQNLGSQETGVTSAKPTSFGRATRDHYDEGAWAMTLFNSSAREIIISPNPADRRRVDGEPAFLRPGQDSLYLGGLLTILHSIPLAREALLLRNRLLPDYGDDPQWWNGQPINLPKIVTLQDVHDGDTDWDDIIYETQRLIALLDTTNRAFGSIDALASLNSMSTYGPEGTVGKFLETWQEAAVRADPGNQLATVFSSSAHKRPLSTYDPPIERDFFIIDPFVEPEHGQTLYDVLDRTVWSDRPGEELDDVWLEHIADVLTIKLESSDPSKSIDVKIPPVFYPDRYLASCRDAARDFRMQRLQIYEDIFKLESLINHYTAPKSAAGRGMTSQEILEQAATAAPIVLQQSRTNGTDDITLSPETEAATANAQWLADELREISRKIGDKLKDLELRKEKAMGTLRSYSKALTEPSASPGEPPYHKYTLRGVCTEPHVTYVLRRDGSQTLGDEPDSKSTTAPEWQWWRISFSTEDAKTRQMESNQDGSTASRNADVIGYTARKVREIEVLRAAREESKTVLLVYANENSMRMPDEPAPSHLQEFVDRDNKAFEAEFQDTEPMNTSEDRNLDLNTPPSNPDTPMQTDEYPHEPDGPSANTFDYQPGVFDREMGPEQEMQERSGRPLLSRSNTGQNPESRWDEAGDVNT